MGLGEEPGARYRLDGWAWRHPDPEPSLVGMLGPREETRSSGTCGIAATRFVYGEVEVQSTWF